MKKSGLFYLLVCLWQASYAQVEYLKAQKVAGEHTMPHVHNGRFYNHAHEHKTINHVLDALKIFWATKLNTTPYDPHGLLKSWVMSPDIELLQSKQNNIRITWLGHATFLIQIGSVTIITDPVFFNLSFLYKRSHVMPLKLDQMPNIDIVLISHTHRDHMDEQSLLLLKKYDPIVLVPQGAKEWFIQHGFSKTYESSWWVNHELKLAEKQDSLKINCLPAVHWCQRFTGDMNKALWCSWLIESPLGTTYFAGDSAIGAHFKEISSAFSAIDIALMPVGPNEPRNLMKHSHVSAQEAGQAFLDLNAKWFVPMHWGTFRLGTDYFHMPIELLTAWWEKHKPEMAHKSLQVIKFGQTIVYSK